MPACLINKEGARYFGTVVLRVDDGDATTRRSVVYRLIPVIPEIQIRPGPESHNVLFCTKASIFGSKNIS